MGFGVALCCALLCFVDSFRALSGIETRAICVISLTIKKCLNNGRPAVRLNIPAGPWGKRQRKFFATEAEAKEHARTFEERIFQHGSGVAPVGQEEMLAMGRWLKEFNLGQLEEIVRGAIQERGREVVGVAQAVKTYQEVSRVRGAGKLHLSDLKTRLKAFGAEFGEKPMRQVSTGMIENWLDRLPLARESRRNHLKVVRGFFEYGINHGWVSENPTRRIKLAPAAAIEPAVLTAEQMLALLARAQGDVLWFLALGGFAGMRSSEILTLDFRHIDLKENHLAVLHLKTSNKGMRDRYVELAGTLRLWVESMKRPKGGDVIPFADKTLRRHLAPVLKAAGVREWPDNGLRHSFCTYHLAAYGDPAATAVIAGHTNPATTYAHYRKLATKAEGLAWFALTPARVEEERERLKAAAGKSG